MILKYTSITTHCRQQGPAYALVCKGNAVPIHYSDIIMNTRWHLKSPVSRLFTQPFTRAHIKENIKAPGHWPLCGEFTGDRWIPRTNGQQPGKCFIWWRHHDLWEWAMRNPTLWEAAQVLNTLRPRQNGRHFADNIFKCIFLCICLRELSQECWGQQSLMRV